MMSCDEIQEMLPDYLNETLTRENIALLITHLATCRTCRKEAAVHIVMQKQIQSFLVEPPVEIIISAFDTIPHQERTIKQIVDDGSPLMIFEILNQAFSPVLQTISLAKKLL